MPDHSSHAIRSRLRRLPGTALRGRLLPAWPFRTRRKAPLLSSLLLLPVLALAPLLPVDAGASRAAGGSRHQIWALVHVIDNDKGEGTVDVQIPLEWLRKGNHLTTCEGDTKGIDGRELYRKYKDLPPGEEKVVETLDCHDSKVVVRVANREVEEGPRARSLHITIRDRDKGKDEGGDVDITVPFNAFGMLGNLLGGKWLTFEDSGGDHGKGADADSGFTDVLRRLPPFRLVEVHGDDGTVIVQSE